MAINVNTVYQTVLLILNKEQRGYMTPTEFNSIGTQVQLEIFEKYFEDINQQLRVPQTDTDYADRIESVDEKIAIFKTFAPASYSTVGGLSYFTLPVVDSYGSQASVYKLGTVLYNNETQVQRVDRSDFYHINRSPLTKPTTSFPVYLYENQYIYVKPITIISLITVDYVRKPISPIWGFSVGTLGQYIFNSNNYDVTNEPTGSLNFEIHSSEQTELILKILLYAGVVIKDPQIVQIAASQIAQENQNQQR